MSLTASGKDYWETSEENKKAEEYAERYCDIVPRVFMGNYMDDMVVGQDSYYILTIAFAVSQRWSRRAESVKRCVRPGFQPREPMLTEHKRVFDSVHVYRGDRGAWYEGDRRHEYIWVVVGVVQFILFIGFIYVLCMESKSGSSIGIEVSAYVVWLGICAWVWVVSAFGFCICWRVF